MSRALFQRSIPFRRVYGTETASGGTRGDDETLRKCAQNLVVGFANKKVLSCTMTGELLLQMFPFRTRTMTVTFVLVPGERVKLKMVLFGSRSGAGLSRAELCAFKLDK